MALTAVIMPILPGKMDTWRQLMKEMMENKASADAIRKNAGLHERTFLQETPQGNFCILTFESDDPEGGFAKMMASLPADFAAGALDVHGVDLDGPMPPLPTLIYDSEA